MLLCSQKLGVATASLQCKFISMFWFLQMQLQVILYRCLRYISTYPQTSSYHYACSIVEGQRYSIGLTKLWRGRWFTKTRKWSEIYSNFLNNPLPHHKGPFLGQGFFSKNKPLTFNDTHYSRKYVSKGLDWVIIAFAFTVTNITWPCFIISLISI